MVVVRAVAYKQSAYRLDEPEMGKIFSGIPCHNHSRHDLLLCNACIRPEMGLSEITVVKTEESVIPVRDL